MSDLNGQVVLIGVDEIEGPEFPRFHSQEELRDLGADIQKNDRQIEEGLVEPNPKASEGGKKWKLLVGWGRLQALQLIGWTQMRCMVVEGLSRLQRLQLVSSENSKRTNVTPFFQAMLLEEMKKEIPEDERTQKKLAEVSGFNESEVSEYLSIGQIPADLREKFERSNFTFGQLRQIICAENTDQLRKVSEIAIKKELSGREIKAEVLKARKTTVKGKITGSGAMPEPSDITLRVSQKKGLLKVTAQFPRVEDLHPAFAKLCDDTIQWCARHPNAGRSKKKVSAS